MEPEFISWKQLKAEELGDANWFQEKIASHYKQLDFFFFPNELLPLQWKHLGFPGATHRQLGLLVAQDRWQVLWVAVASSKKGHRDGQVGCCSFSHGTQHGVSSSTDCLKISASSPNSTWHSRLSKINPVRQPVKPVLWRLEEALHRAWYWWQKGNASMGCGNPWFPARKKILRMVTC